MTDKLLEGWKWQRSEAAREVHALREQRDDIDAEIAAWSKEIRRLDKMIEGRNDEKVAS